MLQVAPIALAKMPGAPATLSSCVYPAAKTLPAINAAECVQDGAESLSPPTPPASAPRSAPHSPYAMDYTPTLDFVVSEHFALRQLFALYLDATSAEDKLHHMTRQALHGGVSCPCGTRQASENCCNASLRPQLARLHLARTMDVLYSGRHQPSMSFEHHQEASCLRDNAE
jgi:hypothetical protein